MLGKLLRIQAVSCLMQFPLYVLGPMSTLFDHPIMQVPFGHHRLAAFGITCWMPLLCSVGKSHILL